VAATVVLAAAMLAGVSVGPAGLSLPAVARALLVQLPWHPHLPVPGTAVTIIWQVRMPRVVLGALVGAMLSGSGAAYQGIFRNQGVILSKAALNLLGLPAGPLRLPLVEATEAEIEQLRQDLRAGGVHL
jgi:ABC-type enterobactin transport system permease subunit